MALPPAIATAVQNHLDTWWAQPHNGRPRLSHARALFCKAAQGTQVVRVRMRITPGADLLGPCFEVEIDTATQTFSQQFRPTTQPGDVGKTLDDVDQDGPTNKEMGLA